MAVVNQHSWWCMSGSMMAVLSAHRYCWPLAPGKLVSFLVFSFYFSGLCGRLCPRLLRGLFRVLNRVWFVFLFVCLLWGQIGWWNSEAGNGLFWEELHLISWAFSSILGLQQFSFISCSSPLRLLSQLLFFSNHTLHTQKKKYIYIVGTSQSVSQLGAVMQFIGLGVWWNRLQWISGLRVVRVSISTTQLFSEDWKKMSKGWSVSSCDNTRVGSVRHGKIPSSLEISSVLALLCQCPVYRCVWTRPPSSWSQVTNG